MRRRQCEHRYTTCVHLRRDWVRSVWSRLWALQGNGTLPCSKLHSREENHVLSLEFQVQTFRRKARVYLMCGYVPHCTDQVGPCSTLQVAAQNTKSADKHSCSPPSPRLKLTDADLTEAVQHHPEFFAVCQRLGYSGPTSTGASFSNASWPAWTYSKRSNVTNWQQSLLFSLSPIPIPTKHKMDTWATAHSCPYNCTVWSETENSI